MSPLSADQGGGDDGGEIVAEINVTPLTDIFLVLLIIFMVTSTAMVQQGTRVALPRSSAATAEGGAVVVTATSDHRLELDGVPVERDSLAAALSEALAKKSEKAVVLRGDRAIALEEAVQLMTIARQAGAERLAIATTAPEGR
jgi:biopolymer transport protein ExbD